MLLSTQPDYKNSQKNNWRIATWRNIAKRLDYKTHNGCVNRDCRCEKKQICRCKKSAIRPSNSLGVYLPGEHDYDRKYAIKFGFRPYNLIGVDNDIKIVKAMRKRGNICIHGNIIDVIRAWPKSTNLQFVNADFCAGFNRNAMLLNEVILSESMSNNNHPTVFCVNMQRGRDSDSNMFRLWLNSSNSYDLSNKFVINGKIKTNQELIKHRGIQLYLYLIMELQTWRQAETDEEYSPDDWVDITQFTSNAKPKMSTYKSNVVYMDSVIFNWWFDLKTTVQHKDTKTLNKIKAALAVRSMKINGTVRQSAIA